MRYLILVLVVAVHCALGGQEHAIGHDRSRRQAQQHQQQVPYRPFSQAPAHLQQIVQSLQHRDPIVHLPPQPIPRLTGGGHSQQQQQQQQQAAPVSQYKPTVQYAGAPQQPTYQSVQPQYRQQQQQLAHGQQQQQNYRALYKQVPGPQTEQRPNYSTRLPPQIQQLLQAQAAAPNSIPAGNAGHPQSKLIQASRY